jgi:hypothetical protein|tara:strand:+ start:4198 stop:4998 length:801 start_codon:yes stop_codon:yes gene_type:complete
MENLVFLIKSYHNHLSYTKQLIDSVNKHNKDNIKVYLAIPEADIELFKSNVDTSSLEIITDESITGTRQNQTWHLQQLVKMKFSEMNLCKNYFWIDGDSYFIRDFFISDFMYNEEIPYTTIHENKDLFSWMAETDMNLLRGVLESYQADRQKVMDTFNRTGKYYDWTCPNLWSVKVFDHMRENYLIPNKLTFETLLQYVPGELIWYGEYLLASQAIPIIPAEPWFKPFHYLQQMNDCKSKGNTEETLSMNYLGIVMPSKETNQLRF